MSGSVVVVEDSDLLPGEAIGLLRGDGEVVVAETDIPRWEWPINSDLIVVVDDEPGVQSRRGKTK